MNRLKSVFGVSDGGDSIEPEHTDSLHQWSRPGVDTSFSMVVFPTCLLQTPFGIHWG